MKTRFTLFTKILLWFLLTFFVIGNIAFTLLYFWKRADTEGPFKGQAMKRMRADAHLIAQELRTTPETQWDEVLDRWSEAHQAQYLLFRATGFKGRKIQRTHVAGKKINLPEPVQKMMEDRGRFIFQTKNPDRVWVGHPLGNKGRGDGPGRGQFRGHSPQDEDEDESPGPPWAGRFDPSNPLSRLTLLVVVDPSAGGLIAETIPWVAIIGVVIGLAVLLWFPLVRNLTRPIGQLTGAAEQIARGRFDVRVDAKRSDEIGRLGAAVNDMAARLSRLVSGQKRFLGDVSHELRSPLTRIQVALELLDQNASSQQKKYIQDGLEEIDNMSLLVGELLSVARAQNDPSKAKLSDIAPLPVIEKVIEREGGEDVVRVEIPAELKMHGEAELLSRAVSNLLRNSLRYAEGTGAIVIHGERKGGKVRIEVTDSGPGVPAADLPNLFDPFFRPELDRDRASGGAGLGLSIVKTCVEACGGSVSARNLSPKGFAVEMIFEGQKLPG